MRKIPYCSRNRYEKLYASYLQSDPNKLLDYAGFNQDEWPDLFVLDLCGGNGRLSLAAKERGARVVMVDADDEMHNPNELSSHGINVRTDTVEVFLQRRLFLWLPQLFGAVFCQQAVNYWLTKNVAKDLRANMLWNGTFVFNTFNTKPPTRPVFRSVEMEDHTEYEAFYSVNNMVHHIQMREGFSPHQTSFLWISPNDFDEMLSPYFEVKRYTELKTDIYVCKAI